MGPVNKLVSRTWLLWALRSFRSFTLHCITLLLRPISDRPHFSCIHYKIASLTYNTLQTSQPSYIHQILSIQPPGSTRSSSYLSLSRLPVSSSLKFCNRSFVYAATVLWNGLPKHLRQFAHPNNPPLNFTYPPLALSSATFHSRLKIELFKLSYPDSTPEPPPSSPITIVALPCLLGLTFPDFDMAPKRNEKFGYF